MWRCEGWGVVRGWLSRCAVVVVAAGVVVGLGGCVGLPSLRQSAEERRDAKYQAPLATAVAQWDVDGHRMLQRTQIVAPVTGVAGGYCNRITVEVDRDGLSAAEQGEVLDWVARVAWATDTHVDGSKPSCVQVTVFGPGFDMEAASKVLPAGGDVVFTHGVSARWDAVAVRDPAAVFGAWPGTDRDVLTSGVPEVLVGVEDPLPEPTATATAPAPDGNVTGP